MNLRHYTHDFGHGRAAFTMVEIAISIGVIAIALIAIIGVLPTGLQINRDNREETIINHDARVLVQAIRSGGRDRTSDIGDFVLSVTPADNSGPTTNYGPGNYLGTTNLIRLLTESEKSYNIVFASISGAVALRESDMAFRYQVRNLVTNSLDFEGTALADQAYEVRLRFAWPVLPNGNVASEANTYVARTLVTGIHANGVLYAQEYSR
jgi:type II secretory pathway pseudopilin PulG